MDDYKPPSSMKAIGDLFERYRTHFKAPQGSVEKEVIEVIHSITGFRLEKKQVSYTVSTRTISLRVSSILKTEILFKKQEILNHLKNSLGKDNSPQTIL